MMKRTLKSLMLAMLATAVLLAYPTYSMSQVWTNLGLYGGQIHNIAIDPSNPDKVFAGSYMGDGLFVTTDGGSSWQAVEATNDPPGEGTFKNHKIFDIEFAPSDPQTIWVAHNYWVEKSTDGGLTWTHIRNADMQKDCSGCTENEDFRFCQAIAIHPANPNIVYVGAGGPAGSDTNGAIYKTEDGGETWTKLDGIFDIGVNPIPDFNYPIISIEIDANSDNIWAATNGGNAWFGSLYRSNNEGQTWIARSNIATQWYDMALQPHATGQPSQVFMATAYGLVRNTYDLDDAATFLGSSWVLGGAWGTENNIRSVVFDPQDPETVYAAWKSPISWGGDGIGKIGQSTDGGDTWLTYTPDLQFFALGVHPTNSNVIFGGHLNLGMYKSQNNGQVWTPINDGLTAVIINDSVIDPNDPTHILIGTISGLYEKKGSGTWTRLLSNDTFSVLFHPTDSLTVYAGIEGYVAKTIDGGLNWSYTNIPDYWSYNYPSHIAIDPSNTDVVFVAIDYFGNGGAIHKSVDGGASFTWILDGINQNAEYIPMNVVAIDPSDSQHIFAGSGLYGSPGNVGDLWVSTDGGTTWALTSLQNVIVNAFIIDPDNPNIMYAGCGYSGGTSGDPPLYKSTDGGVTWAPSYDGIPVDLNWNAVTDLEFHPQNANIVYASTNGSGVYISSNQAGNWLNLGTPVTNVWAISTSSLYAATDGGLLQCSGTGLITGNITDAATGNPITSATIFSDLGGLSTLVINGQHMMISPSGICNVTVVADGHANTTVNYVTVWGGDVTNVDIQMQAGAPDYSAIPQTSTTEASAGSYCFIATAAYGSPMAKQVEVLRQFRDSYLLPHVVGQKLVALYYRTGKPIAMYMDSHPWLKFLVRGFLYPIVGLAWLLVSTSAMTKGFICLCIFICVIWVIRRCIKMRGINKKSKLKYATNITMVLIFTVLIFSGGRLHAGTLFQQVGIASSPNTVGSGARAVGMGGAFIAIADDATAASWNPAGLIQLEKPEVSIVSAYNNRREDFSSTVRPETNNTGEVDDCSINYFSAAYPFLFHKNMVVSINYQRLFEFNRSFAHQLDYSSAGVNLQQEKNFMQDGSLSALGIAASVEITPRLSFGATFNIWTDQFVWKNGWNDSFTEHAVGSTAGVPVTIDTHITDDYSHFRGVNANFGMLWDINQYLTVGAVVKTPFKASLVHTYSFDQTQTFGPPTSTTVTSRQDLQEGVELEMPLSYGIGVAWRLSDAFTIDFDIYRTDWSKYILTDGQGNKFSPIDGQPEGSSDVKDTTQIRFGGEYLFIKKGKKMAIPVRAGIFYDPEPSQGGLKDFYGIAVGSGIAYKQFVFDAAYQLRWGHDVDTGNLIATSEADITQHLILVSMIYHF